VVVTGELTYQGLRDKLLAGYAYRIKTPPSWEDARPLVLNTGIGGARMLIDSFEKAGVPAEIAAEAIEVNTDRWGYVPIGILKVTKTTYMGFKAIDPNTPASEMTVDQQVMLTFMSALCVLPRQNAVEVAREARLLANAYYEAAGESNAARVVDTIPGV
jgi:hypothetical protein